MTKTCENTACGREFPLNRGPVRNAKRRFCSRACSRANQLAEAAVARESKVCGGDDCTTVYFRSRRYSQVEWEKRTYCSSACSLEARKSHIVEDVEWIIDTDHPESIARRVGYSKPENLVNRLRKLGAVELADKLARKIERYRVAAIDYRDEVYA